MTYTIDNVPAELTKALRERAQTEGKTVEQIALEALSAYANHMANIPKRDLSFMGNLSAEDAKSIEQAHEFCDRIGMIAEPTK